MEQKPAAKRAWLDRGRAALAMGRELVRAFEAAAADGAISEAELGMLAVRTVRIYERLTGRCLVVVAAGGDALPAAAQEQPGAGRPPQAPPPRPIP